jgi:hypothetical protein
LTNPSPSGPPAQFGLVGDVATVATRGKSLQPMNAIHLKGGDQPTVIRVM